MKILLINNYDSFVYNIANLLEEIKVEYVIKQNDDPSILNGEFSSAIISPGPSTPENSGLLTEYIRRFYKKQKMLGICLGHQAICMNFGATLKKIKPMHGVQTKINVLKKCELFNGISNFNVGRYHSWSIDKIPSELELIAIDNYKEVMAIKHKIYPLYGLQFHPESILTPDGLKIVHNWIKI